jgi:hypothetical protein
MCIFKLILLHMFSLHVLWFQTQYALFPCNYNPKTVKYTVGCWSKEILWWICLWDSSMNQNNCICSLKLTWLMMCGKCCCSAGEPKNSTNKMCALNFDRSEMCIQELLP